jgi:hypothetical protein
MATDKIYRRTSFIFEEKLNVVESIAGIKTFHFE